MIQRFPETLLENHWFVQQTQKLRVSSNHRKLELKDLEISP
jgi:hypothetical protein